MRGDDCFRGGSLLRLVKTSLHRDEFSKARSRNNNTYNSIFTDDASSLLLSLSLTGQIRLASIFRDFQVS